MWRPCRWAALPLRNNALAEGSANVSGTMSMAASAAKSFDRSKFKTVGKDARAFGGVHRELAGWTLLLECLRRAGGSCGYQSVTGRQSSGRAGRRMYKRSPLVMDLARSK